MVNYTTSKGNTIPLIYIDPNSTDKTFDVKDALKNKFGASFIKLNGLSTWGWYAGKDPEKVIREKVQPCIEYLRNVEKKPNPNAQPIITLIDTFLEALKHTDTMDGMDYNMGDKLKDKVQSFKLDLINCMSSAEFKKRIEPIIKFKRGMGHQYSFINCILIILQNPQATMVKSKSNWEAANKSIKPDATPIYLWRPNGAKASLSKAEKDKVTKKFLQTYNVGSEDELGVGAKEQLRLALQGRFKGGPTSFSLYPAYDVNDTVQMDGKDDLIGSMDTTDLPWFDGDSDETDASVAYVDATMSLIRSFGLELNGVDDLGGARGVSKSGSIDYLNNSPKNIGLWNTLVHELSHELLHQKYLSSHNEDLKGYFVGTAKGRGFVEQQAELSAWIVLKTFGYDMETNMNYVGMWGMDEKTCVEVFDSVSDVANRIVDGINKELSNNQANG